MTKGPKFTQHFIPIIESLREMGGSASAYETTDAAIERENISEKELAKTNKNGGSNIRNAIAWARLYLVYSGYIDSSARGVWRLTEKGLQKTFQNLIRLNYLKPFSVQEKMTATAIPQIRH